MLRAIGWTVILASLGWIHPAQGGSYHIKPSDISIPPDTELGDIRRIIHPFENWILVCDENLATRTRVCNVSQTFIASDGEQIFSWSLATTRSGIPMMILRTPGHVGTGTAVAIETDPHNEHLVTHLEDCSPQVCIATLPVGAALRTYMERERPVSIFYRMSDGREIKVVAPFKGLQQALAAIE